MYPIPENQAAMETLIRAVMTQEGLTFILATYKVVDELSARANEQLETPLACGKGCSFCCRQLVTCTGIEWEAIMGWQRARGLFESLSAYFRKWCKQWRNYLRNHEHEIAESCYKPLEDWHGKPCVFLDARGECMVYPARPIDCRTMTSTVRCAQWTKQAGVKRFRHPWELWANNLIVEEAARREGQAQTTPLIHWLAVETGK
ncbi:MAG: hypothetical protein HYW65_00865 [Candidatus Liptonbacteria bacterium]|nr:hypothetical protein [Candidatus Liptonbacteria bacterium]